MIDFHTHSLLSDGVLLPSELARRAQEKGYTVIGITDHIDASNMEFVIVGILKACSDINKNWKIKAIPGVELTHMPIKSIKPAVEFVRSKGIKLVLVHGETLSEPVIPGTNKEALLSGADILAHPGIISLEDGEMANTKGIYLEISARSGHCMSNGHIAKIARQTRAKLIIDSDAHGPGDLIDIEFSKKILLGAGLDKKESEDVFKNARILACKLLG